MSCSRKLYVIFPAAGSGNRMHSDKNKLLMEVDGIAVIDRTLSAFKKFADEKDIDLYCVLVVSPGKIAEWEEHLDGKDYSSIICAISPSTRKSTGFLYSSAISNASCIISTVS